jgi:NAD(P)-dependent dehydrogenase (short-subunit alcohol dehydrogenase family)
VSGLSFDGRVAVVTGAGRGIGQAYARRLAARGAAVVVNDLGGSAAGEGADEAPATTTAAGIVEAGGRAVADTSDISSAAGAQELVDAAVAEFGRLDIVVNNAGIMRWARFPDVPDGDLDAHLAVHTAGSFHTARAAWPLLAAQGYGRIVMTTSAGLLGHPANTAYATAKGGVVGLTRSLARAGRKVGITVNAIAPAAMTRLAGDGSDAEDDHGMAPGLVAPMAAFLAHEDCPVTGEILAAGAGRFSRLFVASTPGWRHEGPGEPSIEDVAAHWDAICDEKGYTVPADLTDWSATFTQHLAP